MKFVEQRKIRIESLVKEIGTHQKTADDMLRLQGHTFEVLFQWGIIIDKIDALFVTLMGC